MNTDPSSQQFSSNSGSLQNLEGGATTTNKKLFGAREVLSQETLQELNKKLKPTQRKYDGNLDQVRNRKNILSFLQPLHKL